MLTTDQVTSLGVILREVSQGLIIVIAMVDREVHSQGDFTIMVDGIELRSSLKEILSGVIDASALL